MAQKDEPSRDWDSDPSAASGGHLASGSSSGESWFEVLNAPLPSEIERREARQQREAVPTQRSPARDRTREELIPARRTTPIPQTRRRRGTGRRRVRRTIRRVDPLSVLKISIVMYALLLVLWLGVVAVVFNFLSGLGLFDTINNAAEGFALEEVEVTLGTVEKWAFIVGLVFVVVGSIVNVIVALLYNMISSLIGGLEVTFTEREQ